MRLRVINPARIASAAAKDYFEPSIYEKNVDWASLFWSLVRADGGPHRRRL
jgi:hypothetical protein